MGVCVSISCAVSQTQDTHRVSTVSQAKTKIVRLRDITLANWLQVVELTLDVQEETRRLPSRGHPLRAPILRLGSPPIFRSPTHVHDNFRQTYPLLTALAPRTLKKQNLGFSGFLDAGSQIRCRVRPIRIQLSMHIVCLRNPGTVSLQRLQRRWRADFFFLFLNG